MNTLAKFAFISFLVTLVVGCGGSSTDGETEQNTNAETKTNTDNSSDTNPKNSETTSETNTGSADNSSSDNAGDTTTAGFKGTRGYSTKDGYSVNITGMAISSCSGACFVVRGGEITADNKPVVVATKDKGWNIVRLLADNKTIDTSFASNGVLSIGNGADTPEYSWEIDASDRILVLQKDYWGVQSISRYTKDGALDTSFATGGKLDYPSISTPTTILELKDGRILIGGNYTAPHNNLSNNSQWAFTLLTSVGAKDAANPQAGYFVIDQPNPSKYSKLKYVVETNDHLYLMGTTARYGYAIGRLNKTNFAVDTTFGTNGFVEVVNGNETVINDIMVDSKGRIIAVGSVVSTDRINFNNAGMAYGVYRYLSNGTRDSDFGSNGLAMVDFGFASSQTHQINDSAIQVMEEGNKLIITGQSGSTTGTTGRAFSMVRLMENGAIDSTFAIGHNHTQVDKYSTQIYFKNITSEPHAQSLILDNKQGRLVGYGVLTDKFGNINQTTPLKVQWWD